MNVDQIAHYIRGWLSLLYNSAKTQVNAPMATTSAPMVPNPVPAAVAALVVVEVELAVGAGEL